MKAPAFKKGDKAKRTCDRDCTRIRKCDAFAGPTKSETVQIDRMNPLVHGCYDVVSRDGTPSTCPQDRLDKIEEKVPYWGTTQNDPPSPTPKPLEDLNKKPEPEAPAPVAGIDNFGYGPACSFPTCHAMRNEDHSSSCPKEGPFNPESK